VAVGGVALEEAGVEVAVVGVGEGRGLALEAVGLDVAADEVLHEFSPDAGGYPPGGWWLKVKWMQ
jgi:hypothetical protein